MRIDCAGLLIEEFMDSDDDDDETIWAPASPCLQPASMTGTNAKSLIDLPEDTMLEILKYFDLNMFMDEHWVRGMWGLCAKRDTRMETLLSLSLVCKSLSRLAQPLLYQYPRELQVPSVRRQFTRTIASRPDLAARVRYVVYEVHSEDFEGIRESQPAPTSRQLYKTMVPQVKIGDKRAFIKALYSGECDAEYAFLFHLLPAMSTLRFSMPYVAAGNISWTLSLLEYSLKSYRKMDIRGPFCSLRTLSMGWNEEGSDRSRVFIGPEIIQNFASLPLLNDVYFRRPFDNPGPSRDFCSQIKSLHFLEAELPVDLLTGLCSICNDLELLSFCWLTVDVHTAHRLFGGLSRFMEIIRSRASTLKSLELSVMDTTTVWESQLRYPEDRAPIGQYLSEFHNLRYLKIAGFFLTGLPRVKRGAYGLYIPSSGAPGWLDTNGLPSSLEELVIDCEGLQKHTTDGYDCDLAYLLPFLERLAYICIEGRLPKLRRLQLRGKYTPVHGTFEPIEALLAQANVVVTLHQFPEEGGMPFSSPFDRVNRTLSGGNRRDVWRESNLRDGTSKLLKNPAAKSVVDLPTEMWNEILSYLDPSGFIGTEFEGAREIGTLRHAVTWRLSALADFCRVSKRFCDISQPLLYKAFCDYGKLRKRLRFINTLATYPRLAGYVKELHIGYHDNQRRYYKVQEASGITATFGELMQKASMMEIDRKDEWLQHLQLLRSPYEDADVPVLLSLVPSLEVLSFGAHEEGHRRHFPWTFDFIAQNWKKLHQGQLDANPWGKLRRFAFRLSGKDNSTDEAGPLMASIIALPFLPNLRCLQITGGEGVGYDDYDDDDDDFANQQLFDRVHPAPGSSPIDTLHLEAGKMDLHTICVPIEAARALKSFTLTYTTTHAAHGELLSVPAVVVGCLRDRHAATLERLALLPNERDRLRGTVPANPPSEAVGAEHLRPLAALRALALSALFLPIVDDFQRVLADGTRVVDRDGVLPPPPMRADIFPPSLERLTVDGLGVDVARFEDWLWALVEAHEEGKLPRLRAVALTRMAPDALTAGEFMGVGEHFARAGVAFTVNGLWDAGVFFGEIWEMPEGALEDDEPLEDEDEEEEGDEGEEEERFVKRWWTERR